MIYNLQSQRPEIKFSEVTLKKILTASEINFKFAVLNNQQVPYTSKIECVNLQLTIQVFNDEEKLTLQGEKAAVVKVVSLIRDYYGSLSDFKLSSENDTKSVIIAGNTSEKEIHEAI